MDGTLTNWIWTKQHTVEEDEVGIIMAIPI